MAGIGQHSDVGTCAANSIATLCNRDEPVAEIVPNTQPITTNKSTDLPPAARIARRRPRGHVTRAVSESPQIAFFQCLAPVNRVNTSRVAQAETSVRHLSAREASTVRAAANTRSALTTNT